MSRNVSTLSSSRVVSALPSPDKGMSPRLSPTLEESGLSPKLKPQDQRRSVSEPVSPRASFSTVRSSMSHYRDGTITCFPRLLSRTSTSDWLTPLGLLSDPHTSQQKGTASDLYARGIDAHSGVDTPKHLDMLEESPSETPGPIKSFPSQVIPLQWPRKLDEGPPVSSNRTGSAIGVSSHRRKSTIKPMEARNLDSGHSLLDQLRRYSFMPLSDHTPESIREALPPARTPADIPLLEEGGRKRSSQELLQDILDRKLASDRTSQKSSRKSSRRNSRAYAPERRKKTGSKATQPGGRSGPGRMSCSEDQTPHICMDEQPTPLSGSEMA